MMGKGAEPLLKKKIPFRLSGGKKDQLSTGTGIDPLRPVHGL